MLIVGIDPGVQTGMARWDTRAARFTSVETLPIHRALAAVLEPRPALVVFEDARMRTWFGKMDREHAKYGGAVREGAGSIKRDCGIWDAFLTETGLPFLPRKPKSGQTKWNPEHFSRVTGWAPRTSEHARDAGVLVFGLTDQLAANWISLARQNSLAEQARTVARRAIR